MTTLSKKCKYALRALYLLTREYGNGPILSADISAQEHIPQKFLEAILLQLKQCGIVTSKKGRNGGYCLAMPPVRITIGSIVRVIDGPLTPLPCVDPSTSRKCLECAGKEECETRLMMREVEQSLSSILDGTTLLGLCERVGSDILTYEI